MKYTNKLLALFYRMRWSGYLYVGMLRMYYYVCTSTEHYVALQYSKAYNCYLYDKASDQTMAIIGNFLIHEVKNKVDCYRNWALKSDPIPILGNMLHWEKCDKYIFLTELYHESDSDDRVKLSIDQFIQLLDDWESKVCKPQPRQVKITRQEGTFTFETTE